MQGLTTDPVRERRLHRMARGQGLGLARSPRRNPGADDYGRYLVYDLSTQEVVHARRGSPFCFEVDELEEYLTGGVRTGW